MSVLLGRLVSQNKKRGWQGCWTKPGRLNTMLTHGDVGVSPWEGPRPRLHEGLSAPPGAALPPRAVSFLIALSLGLLPASLRALLGG